MENEGLPQHLSLKKLGLTNAEVFPLRVIQGIPFIQATVDDQNVLFVISSNTTQMAWSRAFARKQGWLHVAEGTDEVGGKLEFYDTSCVRVFDRRLKGAAPTMLAELRGAQELPLPLAGHVGMIGHPKSVVLDVDRRVLAISWIEAARVPSGACLIKLQLAPAGDPYQGLTSGIAYGDSEPPLPLRMRVSVSSPRTALCRSWIAQAELRPVERFFLKLMAGVSRRFETPAVSWQALVGAQKRSHRLTSHVIAESLESPALDGSLDGYVGMDLLGQYTCLFHYDLAELWLLE